MCAVLERSGTKQSTAFANVCKEPKTARKGDHSTGLRAATPAGNSPPDSRTRAEEEAMRGAASQSVFFGNFGPNALPLKYCTFLYINRQHRGVNSWSALESHPFHIGWYSTEALAFRLVPIRLSFWEYSHNKYNHRFLH